MMRVFNSAKISPDIVKAGDSEEFVITLEIGDNYTAEASRIVFDFSCTLGTSCPTRELNEKSGYVEAYVSSPTVTYNIRCWDLDYKHFVDAEHKPSDEAMRMVVLDLSAGVKSGDTIAVHWGETLGGFGPGAKVSSVVPRSNHKGRIDIRYFDSQDKGMPDYGRDYEGYSRPIPDAIECVEYEIKPRELRRMRLLRNTTRTILLPYDLFWNTPEVDDIKEFISTNDEVSKNSYGTFEFVNKEASVVDAKVSLQESSDMADAFDGLNIYWGDIHSHSAYSIDCIQRSGMDMTPDELMKFARYRAGLDFYAVTDHHIPCREPLRHIGKNLWQNTLDAIEKNHQNGEFVVFPGFEFTDFYGDICMIFKDSPNYDLITQKRFENVSDFYSFFGDKIMAIAHLHSFGRFEFGKWREGIDAITPVLELYSDHGSYEREDAVENGRAWCKPFRGDHCGEYFLKQGYKYGFVANSDDHKGHVGVSGVTAVFAKELTREAIWEAYQKRHVYGTTNARIKLIFTINNKLMGSIMPFTTKKLIHIAVNGENSIKRVDLFKDGDLFKTFTPKGKDFVLDYELESQTPDNWYVRVTQIDNHIAYSSPIWFE